MNYSDYRFTLDVQIHQSQVSIPVTFMDTARKLCIGLTDGRKPYTIAEGCRAVFVAKKPDKKSIINDCIIERNVIIYEFSENTTNAEGIVKCEIRLIDADERVLTSPQFTIVVDKNVVRDEEVAISEDESTTLSRIISSEEARVAAEEKREELAEFLSNFGGVITSKNEPSDPLASVWVKPESNREVNILESTDIVQELSDATDKVPSVGLLKTALVDAVNDALEEAKESGEFNGKDGADGKDGVDGKDGADGYTPQKEVDYWTPEDVAEINAYIDEQLGDVDSALDAIWTIQTELIGSLLSCNAISHEFGGIEGCSFKLYFEEGMTWEDWLVSKYNINGAYIYSDNCIALPHDSGNLVIYTDTTDYVMVSLNDNIIANHTYGLYLW